MKEVIKNEYYALSPNLGFLQIKLPQLIIDEVKTNVDQIKSNFNKSTSAVNTLAGEIKHEYDTFLGPNTTNFIKEASINFLKHQPFNFLNSQRVKSDDYDPNDFSFVNNYKGKAWINFQKKYEYNPVHNHAGLLSYVIWYQVPYLMKNEDEYSPKQNNIFNGRFSFLHPLDGLIHNCNLDIDKTMEGTMAIFPSTLAHTVYPFYTSDDYRITLSGNLLF